MKLVIFGATGGTGRELVNQALEQGHQVRAFARSPEKLKQPRPNLEVVQGDVLDPAAVEKAITGQDAVLCALGMPAIMDKSSLRTNGTRIIIQAMQATGIRRLVCLSGLGAGDSYEILPFFYKFILAPLVMRHLYADHNAQEKIIKESHLEWTIVRPGSLSDAGRTGQYQHGFSAENKTIKGKVSRADTAEFMLAQLSDNGYMHQAPCLSY